MKDLRINSAAYKLLTDIFYYPTGNTQRYFESFANYLIEHFPEKNELPQLLERHQTLSLKEQQEYYLKTFDVQAICYLDIGYVLFGEDYKRAQLLVNLQAEHQKAGVDCGTELADHLPNVIKLLVSTEDEEFANELGFVILIPAIRFMILKFGETENIYKILLETLLDFLHLEFDGEGLDDCIIPENAFDISNECLIASPKADVCESMCHKNKKF